MLTNVNFIAILNYVMITQKKKINKKIYYMYINKQKNAFLQSNLVHFNSIHLFLLYNISKQNIFRKF